MSFTRRMRGPVAEVHHGHGGGIDGDPLELVQVGARKVGDEHPDEIPVGSDDDTAAGMPSHDPLDLVEEARLRVHEALPGGELKARRTALHRTPELGATKGRKRAARPFAGVHLDQGVGGAHREPPGRREGLQSFDASFEGARVDRGEANPLEAIDERGRLSAAALVQVDPLRTAVQARSRHGREAVTDQEEGRHRVEEHTWVSASIPRVTPCAIRWARPACGEHRPVERRGGLDKTTSRSRSWTLARTRRG